MEFEGNLTLERAPSRRWVAIVAVVVPVAAFVMVAAWFIRAYVAPPMAAIPSPLELAAIPAKTPARAPKVEPPAPAPARAVPTEVKFEPPAPPSPPAPAAMTPTPVFTSLAAAPPTIDQPAAAFADPNAEPGRPLRETTAMAPPAAAIEASEPIAGPVPLPPMRPRLTVAQVVGIVPLPRPRPTDEATPPSEPIDSPAIYRHHID